MHKTRIAVKVKGKRSKWLDLNVCVHQGSVLSSFLFAIILEEIIKDVKGGLLKKIFCAELGAS